VAVAVFALIVFATLTFGAVYPWATDPPLAPPHVLGSPVWSGIEEFRPALALSPQGCCWLLRP